MESSNLWFQGNLFNMGGVRRFYHHQSRLLQGGFSALFGGKIQELYLKLSFSMANLVPSSSPSRIPDVLGIIVRAKGSQDAMKTSSEVSQIGQFTCDSEAARFHERGILHYARKSVQFDMELLEGIREKACQGIDAFDTIIDLKVSDTQRITALSTFLLQALERMAMRLKGFYVKLAQHSVFHAEMEKNPARSRWNLLKRKIRDGTFFVLTQEVTIGQSYAGQDAIEFDHIINQIQQSINRAPTLSARPRDLTQQHVARGRATPDGVPAIESHGNAVAVKRMSFFMTSNMRAIRRLSRMPLAGLNFEHLMATYGHDLPPVPSLPTPPSSHSSSSSRETDKFDIVGLNSRATAARPATQALPPWSK